MRKTFSIVIVPVIVFLGCKKMENLKIEPTKIELQVEGPDPINSRRGITIFPKINEAHNSKSFVNFRDSLFRLIDDSNQDEVLNAISDELEFNPGTSKGKEGVIEVWNLDGSAKNLEPFAKILKAHLSNGGCFSKLGNDSTFTAPYYNCISPEIRKTCQESGCGIVVEGGCEMFDSPENSKGKIDSLIGNELILSYADTVCDKNFNNCTWRKIIRANGQTGFIRSSFLQTESDGEVWVVKEPGGWKIRILRAPGILLDDT